MITASAPVRICDIGGWTDTWFGGPGRVVHLAVGPGAEVQIGVVDAPPGVVLDVRDFGDRYRVPRGDGGRATRHPLLEAAIDAVAPPADLALEVRVRSAVPPGCATGTSASVAVALLGALHMVHGQRPSPADVAAAAHRLEVEGLGWESGVQDQLASAFGGINYVEVGPYPQSTVRALGPWPELGPLLSLVYLGRAHDSSAVHRAVIHRAGRLGPELFDPLRDAALDARRAVESRDAPALGRAMSANTEAQRALHPGLVGRDAAIVGDMAEARGALGWKVNGAGGDGGSLTVLSATAARKHELDADLATAGYQVIATGLSATGLEVVGGL